MARCRDVCRRSHGRPGPAAYELGEKHCVSCAWTYAGSEGTRCPCCSRVLRTHSRASRASREKTMSRRGIRRIEPA